MAITETLTLLLAIHVNCTDNLASSLTDTVYAKQPQHAVIETVQSTNWQDSAYGAVSIPGRCTEAGFLTPDSDLVSAKLIYLTAPIDNEGANLADQTNSVERVRASFTSSQTANWQDLVNGKTSIEVGITESQTGNWQDSVNDIERHLASFTDSQATNWQDAVAALTPINVPISDSLSITDQVAAWNRHRMFLDATSGLLRILATPSDSQTPNWADLVGHTLVDATAEQKEATPSDALSVTDDILGIIGEYQVTVDETVSLTDAVTHQLIGTVGQLNVTPSDSLGLDDSVSGNLRILSQPTEQYAWADQVSESHPAVGAIPILATPSDSQAANWSDVLTGIRGFRLQPSDNQGSNWSDEASVFLSIFGSYYCEPYDSWTAEDSLAVILRIMAQPLDDLSIWSESMAGYFPYYASISDSQATNWLDRIFFHLIGAPETGITWTPPYTGYEPGMDFGVIADWFVPSAMITEEYAYAEIDAYQPYANFSIAGELLRVGGPRFMSYTQNLVMDRGDEPTWPVTAYQSDGITAYDLTGATAYFTAKESTAYEDSRAVFQKSSPSNGISITDATAGTMTITLSAADTNGLPPRKMRLEYDLQIVTSTGTVITLTRGILVVRPDVTRAES